MPVHAQFEGCSFLLGQSNWKLHCSKTYEGFVLPTPRIFRADRGPCSYPIRTTTNVSTLVEDDDRCLDNLLINSK